MEKTRYQITVTLRKMDIKEEEEKETAPLEKHPIVFFPHGPKFLQKLVYKQQGKESGNSNQGRG